MPSSHNTIKPLIYQDHDGSWTWSLEIGEPFEDGYAVVDRDEGFLTRADAKEAMLEALARHRDKAKPAAAPGPEPPATPTPAKKKKKGAAKSVPKSAPQTAGTAAGNPEWAVIVDGKIIALFVNSELARKFGKSNYKSKHSVERISYAVNLLPAEK